MSWTRLCLIRRLTFLPGIVRPAIVVTKQLQHFHQLWHRKKHLLLKNSLLFMMKMMNHCFLKHSPLMVNANDDVDEVITALSV